jgi:hypothetical protein
MLPCAFVAFPGIFLQIALLAHPLPPQSPLRSIIDKSTDDDFKWIIRLIDKDLRIKVGPKYVLGG